MRSGSFASGINDLRCRPGNRRLNHTTARSRGPTAAFRRVTAVRRRRNGQTDQKTPNSQEPEPSPKWWLRGKGAVRMAFLIRPRIVTYTAHGRKCKKDAPGATATRSHARKWYGQGIPGLPPKKRVPLCTGRAAAQRMLDDLARRAEQGLVGLPSDGRGLIEPLVVRWLDALRIRAGEQHVVECGKSVRGIFAAIGARTLFDLRARGLAVRIEQHVHGLKLTPRTRAAKAKHVRQFVRWLHRKAGILDSDPLIGLTIPSGASTTPRRDLSPVELATLLDTAAASKWSHRFLAGPDRAALYLIGAATGLRRRELARLTPESFTFDDSPRVALPAAATKNRKAAEQPLPPAVANRVEAYLRGKPANKPVWPGTWTDHSAFMLAHDLEEAGIPIATSAGRAVFHSLRHSYVSWLAIAAPIAVVRDLARHASISTTNAYAHAGVEQRRAAVDAMPLPGGGQSPLTGLSRSDLEGLVVGLAGLLAIGFVPRLVPRALDSATDDDAPRRKANDRGPSTPKENRRNLAGETVGRRS